MFSQLVQIHRMCSTVKIHLQLSQVEAGFFLTKMKIAHLTVTFHCYRNVQNSIPSPTKSKLICYFWCVFFAYCFYGKYSFQI